ncbi:non-homologous end joining protein Ku [Frankia sp. AgKG'84/4]|uniref:non-homologous end joining protein Ku n=1 Tax=Frankia sp. AgKG'84/4 TaxID=573490 RepID=UPI00200EDE7E|nr:Ku protein [Frankia sp. AgKG'84/4]MCL9794675.1 Ku protein [Frankia sp. AgKG'84/4]
MRSIWKGVISFGLVSIPIRLYSATQERDVAFHQVRRSDGSRIRYRRVAEADGDEVTYADIAKGFELPDGQTVVLTDEDFANLPLSTSKAIDVLEFVPLEQVDPIYFAKSYYVEPDRTGAKPYVLLRDALAESGRVALVKIALRSREQLATLRVRDSVFVLETMMWPDEVREPDFPFLDDEVTVRPQELAMAGSLIDTLSADFDPTRFTDSYREALQSVIDAKVAGRDVVGPPEAASSEPVGDLMAALRASIAAARGEGPNGASDSPNGASASSDGVAGSPRPRKTGKSSPSSAAMSTSAASAAAKSTSADGKAASAEKSETSESAAPKSASAGSKSASAGSKSASAGSKSAGSKSAGSTSRPSKSAGSTSGGPKSAPPRSTERSRRSA